MTDIVEVVVEDDRWLAVDLADLANRAATLAFFAHGTGALGYEISLLACNDAKMTELNAQHRGKSRATNVLSWPVFELAAKKDGSSPLPLPKPAGPWAESLGDIAISFDTCKREASESGTDFADHVSHLILHGCLHLLGYDHERDGDAVLMEALETKTLASIGIADPYSQSFLTGTAP